MTVKELIIWLLNNAKPNDVVRCIEVQSNREWHEDIPNFVPVEVDKHLATYEDEVWIGSN